MTKNLHIQNILKNSKKDTEWKKEAEERKSVRQESRKSGIIATQLAYYMKVNGISQTDLGNRIDVSPQQISKILKGRENLTLGTIEKIESALNIELIQTVNQESREKHIHAGYLSQKSSSIAIDLGTGTVALAFEKPRFYGGSMGIPSLSAFANKSYEEWKQQAIGRALKKFEKIKNSREFHFESEEFLIPILTGSDKSGQKKAVWTNPESFTPEEI